MKVNVEIECTPQEARAAMGLPDLTPVHDRYVQMLTETMQGQAPPELIESMLKGWGPMNDAGMALWRRMFELGTGTGAKPGE